MPGIPSAHVRCSTHPHCYSTGTWNPKALRVFLEMSRSIKCVGISIVVSYYNKVADDWIRNRRTLQVRLPSASSNVSGARLSDLRATQRSRVRGTVGRMLECGIKQEESNNLMARAIKECS